MKESINNRHIIEIKELITPRKITEKLPLTEEAESLVIQTRQAIRDILHGRDRHRLLVVVGPCSIYDPEAAYAYAKALKRVAEATQDHFSPVLTLAGRISLH